MKLTKKLSIIFFLVIALIILFLHFLYEQNTQAKSSLNENILHAKKLPDLQIEPLPELEMQELPDLQLEKTPDLIYIESQE